MGKPSKKLLALLCMLVIVMGVLSACGKGANNAANQNNSGTNTAQSGDSGTSGGKASGGTGTASKPAATDLSGTLTVWTYFGQVKQLGDAFHAKYPNVTVNVKVFPGDQYQTKLLTALQTNSQAPDVFDLERSYIGKFINSNYLTDLSALGAEDLVKDDVPYVQELGRSSDNKIKAIADTSSPGGFWYIKSVAKQWLGTEDPTKISDMVSSWDKIIKLGKQISQKSGGKVHLVANAGDIFDIEAYNTQPWVKNGALNIDPKWKTFYNDQLQERANNVDAKLGFMGGPWANALNNGTVILTAMPAWAQFMVKNKDNSANNKFGLAKTPDGYYNGGTYHAIYSKSKNQKLAYAFLQFAAGAEWQKQNMETTGNMPALLSVYKDNMATYRNPLFGDQNILQVYYDLMKTVPAQKADKYSEDIFSTFKKVASDGYNNNRSWDQVITQFKQQVKTSFPDVKVN